MSTLLPQLDSPIVTGSAFTQARYKVLPEFFKDLGQIVNKHYQQIEIRKWKGHRLLGGDGSTLNLPPSKDIKENFGVFVRSSYGTNRCLARTSFFYDLLNDFVVDSELTIISESEKSHLTKALERITDLNDIYILDRGYGFYNTVLQLEQNKKNYCIRFTDCSEFISNFLASNEQDAIVDWLPSEKQKANARKRGLTPEPLKVRLTKIKLKTGETEMLVSSLLDIQKYKRTDLKWLYNKRWVVEEGFKKLKPKMKVEYFGARKTVGIYQDFNEHNCIHIIRKQ